MISKTILTLLPLLIYLNSAHAKPARYIIRGNPAQIKEIAKAANYKVIKTLKHNNAVVLELPEAVGKMRTFAGIAAMEKDVIFKTQMACARPLPDLPPSPNPNPPKQTDPWGVSRIAARQAFSVTKGKGSVACIVDTGCQKHDDLGDNLGKRISFVDGESESDGNGHGTHVAGTIAALDNSFGVVGVAPEATVICAKALNNQGSGFASNIADGIRWCIAENADLINLSLGSDEPSPIIEDAIAKAVAKGLIVVAAAGNTPGPIGYPARYPTTIAITAMNSQDRAASFTSYGPEASYIAPGVAVLSLALNNRYRELSGTSMATPHAVGVYLLMRAAKQLVPVAVNVNLPPEKQGKGLIHAAKTVGL